MKEKIKQKSIKEFAAESVTLHVEWLKEVLAPIVGAAALEPELLTDICKHIEDCGEERMQRPKLQNGMTNARNMLLKHD